MIGQLRSHETNRRRVIDNNNISQLLRDSFSVSLQPPIWEPPSHYSMGYMLPLGDTIILTLLTYEGINTVQLCGHWALALHYRLIMKKVHRNLWAPSQQFSYFNCFGRSDNEGQFGEFVSICFNYMLAGPSAGWSRVRGPGRSRPRTKVRALVWLR